MKISLRNPHNLSTVAYWVCLIALVTLPWRTPEWAVWLPYIAGVYAFGILTLSVGYHRLFCHSAFRTSKFWQAVFALGGVMFMYGSPIQWSVYHHVHHLRADTDGDPHHPSLWALVFKSYKRVPLDAWTTRRLLRQNARLHRFVDKYFLGILAAGLALLLVVSPQFVLNAYLPGAALVLLVAGSHTIISHIGGRPRDWWFLELVAPAGGDWLHATHHDKPRLWDLRTRWYHIDVGALLIRAIRK